MSSERTQKAPEGINTVQSGIKTIVISFDGLGTPDIPLMMKKPNFRRFMEKAAFCQHVKTVYPSMTYSAHATIATGRYPSHHGIVNNTKLQPHYFQHPDWYWYRRDMMGRTFYDIVKDQGGTVASVLWPVTGGADIDYHVPEIFANRPWRNQIAVSLMAGSKGFQLKAFLRYGRWLLHGTDQPWLDTFVHKTALYAMNEHHPDLTLVHYTDLDHNRHVYGHDSRQAMLALERHDQRLGEWMDVMEGQKVNWVILGDHSSLNEHKAIRLNVLFKEAGLLKTVGDNIADAKVMAKEAGGSCYIYGSKRVEKRVRYILEQFSAHHGNCLEAVYSSQEAAAMGADPSCLLMCEASLGWYFQDSVRHPVIYSDTDPKPHYQKKVDGATHGYSPEKPGYTTFFAIRTDGEEADGASANEKEGTRLLAAEGREIAGMNLVDEGPTIACMLGGSLPEADGHVIHELFEES